MQRTGNRGDVGVRDGVDRELPFPVPAFFLWTQTGYGRLTGGESRKVSPLNICRLEAGMR